MEYADAAEVWDGYPRAIDALVRELGARRVCELGGGANPVLEAAYVARHAVEYVVVDVDAEELAKGPGGYYRAVVADVTAPDLVERVGGEGSFDLVFSVTVAEHVVDPRAFHRNVARLLRPGGRAFHFFPTLYSLPFLLNRLLPDSLTEPMLDRLARGARAKEGSHGKFPAQYRWCRGPTRRQLRRLAGTGLEVTRYVGFFGHWYLSRFPPLQRVVDLVTALLLRRPLPAFTSYAFVTLRKPARLGAGEAGVDERSPRAG